MEVEVELEDCPKVIILLQRPTLSLLLEIEHSILKGFQKSSNL